VRRLLNVLLLALPIAIARDSFTGPIGPPSPLPRSLSFLSRAGSAAQKFPVRPTGRHAAMMILAVSAMALPAVFATVERKPFVREEVSVGISILLLAN
jgi:hypothetical protein